LTTSDTLPLNSKISTLFECQSPGNQYHREVFAFIAQESGKLERNFSENCTKKIIRFFVIKENKRKVLEANSKKAKKETK